MSDKINVGMIVDISSSIDVLKKHLDIESVNLFCQKLGILANDPDKARLVMNAIDKLIRSNKELRSAELSK